MSKSILCFLPCLALLKVITSSGDALAWHCAEQTDHLARSYACLSGLLVQSLPAWSEIGDNFVDYSTESFIEAS